MPFIVPDMIHTLVMGQYIYLWVRKVKKDEATLERACGGPEGLRPFFAAPAA